MSSMGTERKQRDGRTVRAERTRHALVEALLALLNEGRLRPTAAEIADRAGVSERSVFQHFPDREALLEAVAREQYERVMPTIRPVDASLSLAARIDEFVAQRATLYERASGVRRAALLMEPESDVVAGWLTTVRRAGAAEVERVFRREIEATPADEREPLRAALVAACAWGTFEALRFHQGLSVSRTRGALRTMVARLLGER
ncbi:MAG TPA: helix-turn-helix domain-containing protein [Thermoleophilaceae bacterium]|jgi:TetR/AcrR family transcriptional regulator, regulator of autoinduction and epiphytic fitness|nr:helix-turn-helix domain-containing protein [Thermoleophilaceae bacterium]